jgi:hypothetical protein
VTSLRVFPGSEFEPLPGTLSANFLATLSILSKNRSLTLGTLTLSSVNKYRDSIVEYRYIYSTAGYLLSEVGGSFVKILVLYLIRKDL